MKVIFKNYNSKELSLIYGNSEVWSIEMKVKEKIIIFI